MLSTTFVTTTTRMAPLSPVHKCLTRKRQRASGYHAISDDDEFAAEQFSNDTSDEDFDSCDDEAMSGYSSSESSKRPRMSMAQEISGMQSSVRVMEKQVAQASASMLELRSLVQQLVAQRQQQIQCV